RGNSVQHKVRRARRPTCLEANHREVERRGGPNALGESAQPFIDTRTPAFIVVRIEGEASNGKDRRESAHREVKDEPVRSGALAHPTCTARDVAIIVE